MTRFTRVLRTLGSLTCTLLTWLGHGVRDLMLRLRSLAALAAENLFLSNPVSGSFITRAFRRG
jgi:hypothetical protein